MNKRLLALVLALTVCVPLALAPTATAWEVDLPTAPGQREERIIFEETGEDCQAPARLQGDTPGAIDMEGAEKALLDGLLAGEEKIDLSEYYIPLDYEAVAADNSKGHEELDALLHEVRYRYGQLFHFTGGYRFSVTSDRKYISKITPSYSMTGEEYTTAKAFYDKTLDDIVAQVPAACDTNELKALFIHDYLATHYSYDYSFKIYDAYHFFRDGKGVCQAYMLVFSSLMDKLGVPVSYVESDILNHAWNVVQLENGNWYHVDVTWDDPAINGAEVLGGTTHTYFLLSDQANEALRRAYATEHGLAYDNDQVCGEDVACEDTSYDNSIYTKVNSPMVYVPGNGEWYYVSTNQTGKGLYRWNQEEKTGVKLAGYSDNWRNGLSTLVEYEGSLFYAAPDRLCRYELDTGEFTVLKTDSGSALQGFRILDGTLSCQVSGSQELVDFEKDILPWHDAMDGAFEYYYNFGAVGVRRDQDSQGLVLLSWQDPGSGMLMDLAVPPAGEQGRYGREGTGNWTLRAYHLSDADRLTPLAPRAELHTASAE